MALNINGVSDMKKALLSILAIALLVSIAGCTTAPAAVQPTPFPTIAPSATSATCLSQNGLSLTLSLNATTYQPGEPIRITIEEKNTLTTANNITAANEWPVFNYLGVGSCNTLNYPFGIAVVQGYYDAKSISSATPLTIFPLMFCPAIAVAYSYNFQPSSDLAYIYNSFDSKPSPISMNTDVMLTGVWDEMTHADGGYTQTTSNFTPGIYTLVGGDEWDTLVILHFSVSKAAK
jgi:hypothetical protein